MLCVTGAEATLAALSARLDENAALHEVRVDHLQEPWGEDLWSLLQRHAARVLLCCRPQREGGAYRDDEGQRLACLRRGLTLGVRWVDVEADVPDTRLDEAFVAERLVRSVHRFAPGDASSETQRRARELSSLRGAVSKLALTVEDAAHLDTLLAARSVIDGEAVLIGMGPAGLLSRARYPRFGSAWTYVAAHTETATAPGQLDRAEAAHQGLPAAATAPFAALVGGPQVFGSPGPRVYPPLFAAHGLEARSYLPVITGDLTRALPVLEAVGAVGLSVTMPLKREATRLAKGDALVDALGATNSLRLRAGWEATNTDVAGVEVPLRPVVTEGQAVLVLGAGGAAAAAVEAGHRLGLKVTVCSRRPEAAHALAARFEGVATRAWRERGDFDGHVLVNATPVAGETETPWPDVPLPVSVVFDLALGKPALALRRQAEAAGARFLPPVAMWRAQGAAQMGWFFDRVFDADELLVEPPLSASRPAG